MQAGPHVQAKLEIPLGTTDILKGSSIPQLDEEEVDVELPLDDVFFSPPLAFLAPPLSLEVVDVLAAAVSAFGFASPASLSFLAPLL